MKLILSIFSYFLFFVKINARNGLVPTAGQLAYQVSIRSNNNHVCSAAIYNSKWLITAGACVTIVQRGQISEAIVVISMYLDSKRRVGIQYTLKHDQTGSNDIGLIKTNESIVFDLYARPIVLNKEEIGVNVPVIFSGWFVFISLQNIIK